MGWLLRERATGQEWRYADPDRAWDAGGYDTTRFEVHVMAQPITGAPDGYPPDPKPPTP
ncbi:MAG: hypothetical protein JWQ81_5252 [Amycolatopsis sp.]|uniref:hypothetical protein n=1 Tax=Amycolatopsis sp. TaxID=37632 RepID=UPI00260681E8|nr:hypothetical protein [Amycolatopsis sp.]MCU1684513.1 hypothetical protein [Amycolatopsis sp.]